MLWDFSEANRVLHRGGHLVIVYAHKMTLGWATLDALHRTLWLMESRPAQLAEFLRESQVNREPLRLVAQALAGPALKGDELGDMSPTAELSALAKLAANWQSVVEGALISPVEQADRRKGQERWL